jgi:hypothetical protein
MRVSISAHHSPCLVRTCSAFLYFGAVNSVSLSARYWNYGRFVAVVRLGGNRNSGPKPLNQHDLFAARFGHLYWSFVAQVNLFFEQLSLFWTTHRTD